MLLDEVSLTSIVVQIYYDRTFAITRSKTPFSTVAATFAGWGFGDSFYTINSTAYIVRGYHVQQRGVQDLIANTTGKLISHEQTLLGGNGVAQRDMVTILFCVVQSGPVPFS